MVTTTRRPNADTPARWDAALDRAHRNHIQVFADRVTGQHFALSTDATKLYSVDWYGCSCAAGLGADPVCQHRALYREMVRGEDAIVAEQVIAEPEHTCSDCLGGGWSRMYLSGHLNDYTESPCTCTAGRAIRADRHLVAA